MTIRIDAALLKKIEPYANAGIIAQIAGPLSLHMTAYQIDTPLRAAHFLAQAGHESAHFRTLHEYASGAAYEGRKDLGNIYAGDGVKYKGRGIFQLTGRANYRAYGKILGLDLENNPEMAANPEISVRVACEYWKAKGLNGWADRDDINEITRRINGGYNGLADRKACLARAKKALPGNFTASVLPSLPNETIPDAPIAATPPEPWYKNPSIQMTGGTFIASIMAAVSNPYALIAFGLILIAGAAVGVAWWRKSKRDAIQYPTGPVQ